MNRNKKSPKQLLISLSNLIRKIAETILGEYPDEISTRNKNLESYFTSAEKFFKKYLHLTERLKLWFKVRMQLFETIKGLVKTYIWLATI